MSWDPSDLITQLKNLQQKKPLNLEDVESTLTALKLNASAIIGEIQVAANIREEFRKEILKGLNVVVQKIDWSLPSIKENINPWQNETQTLGEDFNNVVLEKLIGILSSNLEQYNRIP